MIYENNKTFHLQGKNISYIMYIGSHGDLWHYYFGNKLPIKDYSSYQPKINSPYTTGIDKIDDASVHYFQEYPTYGYFDLGNPAYTVKNKYENSVSRLLYKSHKIYDGKYSIDGMPSLYSGNCHAQTLEITMTDEIAGFDVILYYGVYDEYDIITRAVKFVAKSDILITSAMSASLELPLGKYEALAFTGSWARERDIVRNPVNQFVGIDISNATGASGAAVNPFSIVCEAGATETSGAVYGFSLIYSGDHSTHIEQDSSGVVRINTGINPLDFEWKLSAGEEFYTPECVLAYSDNGFEKLSQSYHDVYRNNLCQSKWANSDRPVLLNNWEGTYFDFNEDKLLDIAANAKKIGCELFVLDDGWFGKRDDDTTSLGDWFVDRNKLPNGIDGLAKKVNDLGIKFGLWFEPEMISPDSDLYRAHPDWAIAVKDRVPCVGRHQYILDFSRDDVCDYIINTVNNILQNASISYVKWDMNRHMSDKPYKGYNHKFVLGYYKVMSSIVFANPEVLFEGCASGGGRFDPGVLAYMPQIWTSDNSDAAARTQIQYGTSFVYPWSAISAHVSASPNHQNGRICDISYRFDIASTGSFGYELDPTKFTDEDIKIVSEQIKEYKAHRTLFRTGDFFRLENPFDGEYCSWEILAKDKSEIFVMTSRRLNKANSNTSNLKLRGLNPNTKYINIATNEEFTGAELMYFGIDRAFENKDFTSTRIIFKEVK